MKQVVAIDTITGRAVASYRSIAECARKTGASESTIGCSCRLRQYPRSGRIAYRYAGDVDFRDARRKTPSPVFAVRSDGRILGSWRNLRDAARGLSYAESYLHRCIRGRKAVLCDGVPCILVRPNRPDEFPAAS